MRCISCKRAALYINLILAPHWRLTHNLFHLIIFNSWYLGNCPVNSLDLSLDSPSNYFFKVGFFRVFLLKFLLKIWGLHDTLRRSMVALQAHLNPFQMQKRNAENRGQKFLLLSLKSSSSQKKFSLFSLFENGWNYHFAVSPWQ